MRISSPSLYAVSFAVLLVHLVPSRAVSAQADGTPIRIQTTARPGKWITGRSAGITADSVRIIPDRTADTLRFDRRELGRLDVSQGRRSYAGRGALIGAGVGLVIGAAVVATADWDGCSDWEGLCEVAGAEIVALSIAGGAGAGAIIGAFSHHEKWKEVRLEPRISAGPAATLQLGLNVRF